MLKLMFKEQCKQDDPEISELKLCEERKGTNPQKELKIRLAATKHV